MSLLNSLLTQMKNEHAKQKRKVFVLYALSVLLVLLVFWQLRFTGVAMTDEACCGMVEHIHDETCYVENELVCGFAQEHKHTFECYTDYSADVETQEEWQASVPALSGDWKEDLVAVANSQIGYKESTKNVTFDGEESDCVENGYTRYGAWYGNPYADNWSAMFASFCLNYADIPQSVAPINSGSDAMRAAWSEKGQFVPASDYRPNGGDLVFIDSDANGSANSVGIIVSVNGDSFQAVEGDCAGTVAVNTYACDATSVRGYGVLPAAENPTGGRMSTPKKAMPKLAAAPDSGGAIDFEGFITDITLQKRTGSGHAWKDMDIHDATVNVNDELRFGIDYEVPGHTLSSTGHTISYQLPSNITLVQASSGTVYHQNQGVQEEVGTYTISEDGLIQITFNDDYVARNVDNQLISGSISFDCMAKNLAKDDDDKVSIDFNDIVVNIGVTEESAEPENLSVQKSGTIVDNVHGVAEYTVVIDSLLGTSTAPKFEDYMGENGLQYVEGTAVIRDKDGNDVTAQCTRLNPEKTGRLIYQLPAPMAAGDQYTITYRSKLPNLVNGNYTVHNKADAVAKDKDGKEVKDSSTERLVFVNNMLKKSGARNADGTVTWTITVNSNNYNIGGWTLSDIMNGHQFTGTVQKTNLTNHSEESISLPYTFPANTTDSFEVTFTTDYHQELGESNAVNVVNIKPGDEPGDGITAEGVVGIDESKPFVPLTKTAEGLTLKGNHAVLINWKVTIDADISDISAPWQYEDTLQDDQQMTAAQQTALRNSIDQALSEIYTSSEYSVTVTATGFRIDFAEKLNQGQTIEFAYQSTGTVADLNMPQYYHNKGVVLSNGKQVESIPVIGYHPLVHKMDPEATEDTDITEHEYYSVDGKLRWVVQLQLPANVTGPITVEENLPDGVTIDELKLRIAGVAGTYPVTFDGNNGSCDVSGVTISKSGQVITFTLDSSYLAQYGDRLTELLLTVALDNKPALDTEAVFENSVTVKSGDEDIGSDTQTQKITVDATHQAVMKASHYDATVSKTMVPYSLDINPDGGDLVPGSDTLTLTDVLKYYDQNSDYSAELQTGSVHVYARNPDGTKGEELSLTEYAYQFEKTYVNHNDLRTLTMTLPDSRALIVEYTYLFNGKDNPKMVISNTATLSGVSGSDGTAENQITVEIEHSAASATVKGCTVYKHDSENAGIALPGAKFDLYIYDSSQNDYRLLYQDITTDAHGKAVLGTEHGLAYNTAYKLVETEAPDGYILDDTPYIFLVRDPHNATTYCGPASFGGEKLDEGDVIYCPNHSESTQIQVEKVWKDHEGNDTTWDGSIQYQLWRTRNAAGSGPSGNVNLTFDLHGKYSSETVYHSEPQSYPIGSVVQFTIRWIPMTYTSDKKPSAVKVNDQAWIYTSNVYDNPSPPNPNRNEYKKIIDLTYTITLDSDITISGKLDPGVDYTFVEAHATYTPPVVEPIHYDDEYVGKYTVASSNSWRGTVKNLPTTGIITVDGKNKTVDYAYYVKEIDVPGGTEVGYENNNGISEGTIVITNTLPEDVGYELPETGGIGTLPLYLIGTSAVLTGALMWSCKLRRRRERRER